MMILTVILIMIPNVVQSTKKRNNELWSYVASNSEKCFNVEADK